MRVFTVDVRLHSGRDPDESNYSLEMEFTGCRCFFSCVVRAKKSAQTSALEEPVEA